MGHVGEPSCVKKYFTYWKREIRERGGDLKQMLQTVVWETCVVGACGSNTPFSGCFLHT